MHTDSHVHIPDELLKALLPEGSDLLIQRASQNNLDWSWRVRHTNGTTGQSTTRTGAWLHDTLNSVAAVVACDAASSE